MWIRHGGNYIRAIGRVAAEPDNIGTIVGKIRPTPLKVGAGLSLRDSRYLPASSHCPFQVATGVGEEGKIVDVIHVEDVTAVKRSRTAIVAEVVGVRGSVQILTLLLSVDLVQ